jgi:hypothetical protein
MENLERLHIKDGAFRRQSIPTPSTLPKLRVVILQRLPEVPHVVFTNITDLTLHNIILPTIHFADILRPNQSLERLRLTGVIAQPDPQAHFVLLPKLKLLSVSHCSPSPSVILHILSPLPTSARVVVRDDVFILATTNTMVLPTPFLVFGPGDLVHTTRVSLLPGEASIIFRTSNGGTIEVSIHSTFFIDGGGTQITFTRLLGGLPHWGAFPNLRSMHLHIDPVVTGPIQNDVIHSLLSEAPRITHLSFNGPTIFHHICQALISPHPTGTICPELEFLSGTLHHDDNVLDGLRSLCGTVKGKPATIRKISLDLTGSEEQIVGIFAEACRLVEEIKSLGVHEFLLTPIIE